ncbi:DUF1573 domain-containing protein [Candidatus Peregrinibacteria bacterium]|nr:DUF1573 domain-containing protein [Candidatus Peregrinibacteria bacterium]
MSSKKFFLPFLVVVPFIFLFSGCADNSEANLATELKDKPSTGVITIDTNNIDLGDIPIQGGKVDVEFPFKNTGSDSIALLEGVTSCMCTTAVVKGADGTTSPTLIMPMSGPGHGDHGGAGPTKIYQVLNPGESATVIATFDPLAHGPDAVGPITREVVIYTNSTETPEVKFKFSGNVIR